MNIKYIKTTDNKKYDLRDKRITDTDTGIATQSANGLLSSTDKKKLDGIASGAEVNQNAFSNIKIGNTTIVADGKTDTVELTAGNNITITPDATNDKITIAATDTNTTYTFKGGTNQFTVTPSNGTAQTVSVTPSIANNVTGSDLTANTIILGNGNSGVKKSGKTIVTTLGSDDTTLPTSKAVKAAIDALPEPMIFKGTLGKDGTITSLPAAAANNEGYTYKVITDGTYAQQSAKIGDVFISNGSSWNLIPSGDEPSGTVTNVATGTGLTGGPITSSGTISHADTSSQASVSNSGRTYIQSITLDGMGHVTGITSATETVTNTDTKVTQRLYTGDGIMPLLFATEQCGYPGNITNIVYRNDSIYALPSQGWIFAKRFKGAFEGTLYGSAYEAHKLENTTSVGSETQPVYFKQGVPTACSYQLNKTVPSDAVFTDTDTKVTSAANHYTPAEDTSSQLDADASSTTAATWNSTSLVTGVTVKRDAKGHVVGLGVDSIKMPANPNTDNKVCQTLTSADTNLPLLMSYNPNTITADSFNLVFRNNSIYANPSTGMITANKFSIEPKNNVNYFAFNQNDAWTDSDGRKIPWYGLSLTGSSIRNDVILSGYYGIYLHTSGTSGAEIIANNTIIAPAFRGNASSASKLTTNAGSATQPVYFSEGVPIVCSYQLNKTVPSNAVFTDTTYSSKSEANGGTDVSLVTTGEKYNWNRKSNLVLGNTSYTALAGSTKYAGSSTQGGAATSAEKLTNTSNIGNTNQPVYFTASGVPAAISYTINKSVPSNAVFTDTHYTTHLYAGSGTAANAATTNGNTKLTVVDNTTTRNSVTIKGTGGATVTSDANGVVTINSDINSKWFNFGSPSKVDNAYYFIVSPRGTSKSTGSGNCYSIEIYVMLQDGSGVITNNTKFVTYCYWYAPTAGLRVTDPVYSNSRIPIMYHKKAEGAGIGNETESSHVCNIPFVVRDVGVPMAVSIKVEGSDISECTCSRSYSSFNWGQDEPTSWSTI